MKSMNRGQVARWMVSLASEQLSMNAHRMKILKPYLVNKSTQMKSLPLRQLIRDPFGLASHHGLADCMPATG